MSLNEQQKFKNSSILKISQNYLTFSYLFNNLDIFFPSKTLHEKKNHRNPPNTTCKNTSDMLHFQEYRCGYIPYQYFDSISSSFNEYTTWLCLRANAFLIKHIIIMQTLTYTQKSYLSQQVLTCIHLIQDRDQIIDFVICYNTLQRKVLIANFAISSVLAFSLTLILH